MQRIAYLKNLIYLDLWLNFDQNSFQDFIKNFKSIAIHCNQLKSFTFRVSKSNQYNSESNEISCELLIELKLLTRLTIYLPAMNDLFFEDIDKHLPQLKHLSITVDNKTTDKAMNVLSKLQKLQSLRIKPHELERIDCMLPLITDSGLIDVINNCPQISSIDFNFASNITHKTIDALIALALRKPRIQSNHYFYDYYPLAKDNIIFNLFDSQEFQLPNNLVMNKEVKRHCPCCEYLYSW
jgi:hypothetical protein